MGLISRGKKKEEAFFGLTTIILRCGLALAVCMPPPLSLLCSLSLYLFLLTLIFSSAATHDVTLCSLAPPPHSCEAPFASRRSRRRE